MFSVVAVALFLILFIFLFFLSFRAIFIAFVKKKDERSKWIVIKSMADSFVVISALQFALFFIKWFHYDFYVQWWDNFKKGIYIEPAFFGFIILGIILVINTKKHGGKI